MLGTNGVVNLAGRTQFPPLPRIQLLICVVRAVYNIFITKTARIHLIRLCETYLYS